MNLSSPAKNASRLRELLKGLHNIPDFDRHDVEVNGIQIDSRIISKGDLFIACRGRNWDARDFVAKAIDAGARAVCVDADDDWHDVQIVGEVPVVAINNLSENVSLIAGRFYDHPSDDLCLIGITGTNGKTSCCQFVAQIFEGLGLSAGTIGTLGFSMGSGDQCFPVPGNLTTPDSVHIQKGLRILRNFGARVVLIEMSSIGLDQHRGAALNFNSAVFTNLTRDHLDYHETFSEYRDVKKLFFDSLPKNAFALTNIDDKNGDIMLQNTKAKKRTYALKTLADYKAKIIEKSLSGTLLSVNGTEVWTKLIGTFNAYNLLAIIGTADELGLDKLEVLTIVSELESVSGRFEYIVSESGVIAIVDYAHTPDALKNVLETINDIRTDNEKLITVVGCGGDRDKTKRPKMAHIASQLSNQAIFTSDNPRTENPETILEEMEVGVLPENYKKTLTISDRRQAIKTACKFSESGDILLIAGKGHETYQEINGERFHFDDLEEVTQCFNLLKK